MNFVEISHVGHTNYIFEDNFENNPWIPTEKYSRKLIVKWRK